VPPAVSPDPSRPESSSPASLGAELEAALLRALAGAWHQINGSYFKHQLKVPTIALMDTSTRLGVWRGDTRTIEIARSLVLEQPWGLVVEILKHEVAHQYVHEFLRVRDETAHGPAFRGVCERLGIDAASAGLPHAPARDASGPEPTTARILSRIAKLLALAESPNQHEAQLAMAEAQRLMLRHNLEAAPGGGYGFRHLGQPTGRVEEADRLLATILGEHFFVEVIWVPVWRAREGKRGSVLEICGTPENLEMAAYVHAFLSHTAARLWREYQRARRLRGNGQRRTFVSGVMLGFREKLGAQRQVHEEQGLVWVGDADLGRFYRKRHPHIRWTQHSGAARTEAHTHGREAGKQIVIHRGVGGGAQANGKLLGPRRS
jgi:predicted SprT family Zn-dependent metalloprotease